MRLSLPIFAASAARVVALAFLALACTQARPAPEPLSFALECEGGENALAHGRLENAEAFLSRARGLAAATPRGSAEQARVYLALARLRRLQENPRKARHYLGLARFATRGSHGQDSLQMAEVEMESAREHQAADQRDQAVTAVEEALRIRTLLLAANDPLLQETLGELAWAHHLAFHYPRAVDNYRKNLAAMERQDGRNTRDRIVVLNRLAWIFARASELEPAADFNARARAIVAEETPGGGTSDKLLELGLEGLPPPDSGLAETIQSLKAEAHDWIADHHYDPKHFHLEHHLLVALRRLDRGLPLRKVRAGLVRDLRSNFIAFAQATPRKKSDHRYGLPFEPGKARRTVRTSEGAHGFDRVYLHSVDFELPGGSPVVAARDGRVARVVRGFGPATERGTRLEDDPRHGIHVNRVVVLHDDDTYATYLPLDERVDVEEGDLVARGQRLGRTVTLTDGETPLVHFDVRRNGISAGSQEALVPQPVRTHFGAVAHHDGIPLAGHAYSARPVPASPARSAD